MHFLPKQYPSYHSLLNSLSLNSSLIEQQSKLSQNVIVNKLTEVIYDKPLLNYPKLLETALSKFSLQKIGELSNELSPHLVQQAIYNNDEELVLAGLTSLANDQTPTAD